MTALVSAAALIIRVVFDGYIILLLLRFLLQKLGASWHNPVSQFLITLTEKPLKPFRKIFRGFKGFDIAILILAFLIQCIGIFLLLLTSIDAVPKVLGVIIISIGQILSKFVYIYIYAIIINAIASWLPNLQAHPVMRIVYLIVNPLLSKIQRVMPLIAGIDLSPIPAILGLMLINLLIVTPILNIGAQLAII